MVYYFCAAADPPRARARKKQAAGWKTLAVVCFLFAAALSPPKAKGSNSCKIEKSLLENAASTLKPPPAVSSSQKVVEGMENFSCCRSLFSLLLSKYDYPSP